jgi:hypothetical protein
MAGRDDHRPPGNVLFEFSPIGGQMRVVAIDEASGIEVVLIAPLRASQQQMQTLALAKLRRRLGGAQVDPAPSPLPTRGKLV